MSAPQQPGYGQPGFNAPVQGKSRVTVGLLNFFLGSVGAGDFYLGHKQMGIIKIAATVVYWILSGIAGATDSAILTILVSLVGLAYAAFVIACIVMSFMGKWIYEKDANGVPTV